jgi:hypothetical protein
VNADAPMNECMTVVLFGIVVVPMTGLGRLFSLIYTLEMG